MAKIIETLYQEKKLFQILTEEVQCKKVGIFFWHGLGDCIQFLHILQTLEECFPLITFTMLLQNGLGQESLFKSIHLVDSTIKLEELDYDYIFKVHFPVEQDPNLTKIELCNKLEIGIPDYVSKYLTIGHTYSSKLVGVHFCNTAMPDVFNVPRVVANKIWNEILEASYIPIEIHFHHVYDNPVNEKFDFVTRNVRDCKVTTENLFGLLDACFGFIGVPSGPLHYALATKPDKVLYMEREIPITRFTHDEVKSINVNKYEDGSVKKWLSNF